MTVLELIKALLDEPMGSEVYVGKGMGPLRGVYSEVAGNTGTDKMYVILSPLREG